MIDALTPEILEYCENHTSPDSAACRALAAETRETTTASGMLVGRVQGTFLTLLARCTGAKRALEIGTFTGYSALKLAEGLPPDGEVITCDIDAETSKIARRFWAESPHGAKITQVLGPALDTLRNLPGPFDIVFIDADKANCIDYWEACVPKVRPGGLILVDNVLWRGRVLDPEDKDGVTMAAFNAHAAGDDRVDLVILTVRDGVTVACKR
jgi:caffeoyl-CoA O-methyltransferase